MDHAPSIRLKFDPEFFLEYNSRKKMGAEIEFGKDVKIQENRQRIWSPFDVVLGATLKDGKKVSKEEFQSKYYRGKLSPPKDLEADLKLASNYNQDYAAQIETIEIGPVSLEILSDDEISIGSWGWNALGHSDLREARGFTLLAAWLSLHDIRKDNTRLMILNEGDKKRSLQMRVSDWGSGLGLAQGHILGFENQRPYEMPATFLEVREIGGQRKVLVTNFKPNQASIASDKMTYADARWMARKIAQLSPKQIGDALRAAQYSDADSAAYKSKLLMRRNHMVEALDLRGEFTPLDFEPMDEKPTEEPQTNKSSEKVEMLLSLISKDQMAFILGKVFMVTPIDLVGQLNFLFKKMGVPMDESDEGAQDPISIEWKEGLQVKYAQIFMVFAGTLKHTQSGTDNMEAVEKLKALFLSQPKGNRDLIKAVIAAAVAAKEAPPGISKLFEGFQK